MPEMKDLAPKQPMTALGEGIGVQRVLGPRYLLDPVDPKTALDRFEKSGLVLPEGLKKEYTPFPNIGEVLLVGEGVNKVPGDVYNLCIKKGDFVLHDQLAGVGFKIGGRNFTLVLESEVLAILDRTKIEPGDLPEPKERGF